MSERKAAFVPNPVLGGLLGSLPAAIACDSLAKGIVLGLGAALCSLVLGAILPPTRAFVGDRLRVPAALAVSVVLASLYGSVVRVLAPMTYAGLGVYMPLMALGYLSVHTIRRCSSPLAWETRRAAGRPWTIAREAVGFLGATIVIGAVRETIGLGSLSLPVPGRDTIQIFHGPAAPLRILATPAGGFILLGLLTAAYRAFLRGLSRRIP